MFGLQEQDIKAIKKAIRTFDDIECAIIFGSRALGKYKKGSDVEIALKGKHLCDKTVVGLNELLNEIYPLPYYFDILHYDKISNDQLKVHIDTHGIPVWKVDKKRSHTR